MSAPNATVTRSQRVVVLGATGSIGASTLDVVARHPEQYTVVGLAAHRNWEKLAALCRQFCPAFAAMHDAAAARELERALAGTGTRVLAGDAGLIAIATLPEADTVLAAIVGAVGLPSTLAAAHSGKRILLANKEALVIGGRVFMQAVADGGATLLPIDSEHNAVFQCLPPGMTAIDRTVVRRILLTASGGPFRSRNPADLARVTPDEACAHPNWSMGRKISVDSATMMNKGLEVIEAHWLFGAPRTAIDVVIHPQSVIHSLVEYVDGSMLAQLSNPDMRTPIAHALAYPRRIESGVTPLELARLAGLTFEVPDLERFPCLRLAYEALDAGGSAALVLSAANEVAVAAFLAGQVGYLDIARGCEETLARTVLRSVDSLDDALAADAAARRITRAVLGLPVADNMTSLAA
jgi:1-deoxy-D-xylulose-5-phosphate reductoisomerase